MRTSPSIVVTATGEPGEIAILQPPNEYGIQHRAGYDAELPQARDGVCEPPVRNGDAQAALNDTRKWGRKGHAERSHPPMTQWCDGCLTTTWAQPARSSSQC